MTENQYAMIAALTRTRVAMDIIGSLQGYKFAMTETEKTLLGEIGQPLAKLVDSLYLRVDKVEMEKDE